MTLLNHATLTYPDLERLILTYPQNHGAPISDDLLTTLILPRLDALFSATAKKSTAAPNSTRVPSDVQKPSNKSRVTSVESRKIPDPDDGSIEMRTKTKPTEGRTKPQQISDQEQYLLLANHLLHRSPRLLPRHHTIHYAHLLDQYLQPLLPRLNYLLQHPKTQKLKTKSYKISYTNGGQIEMKTKPLSSTTRAILLTSDLFAYFGKRSSDLQKILTINF